MNQNQPRKRQIMEFITEFSFSTVTVSKKIPKKSMSKTDQKSPKIPVKFPFSPKMANFDIKSSSCPRKAVLKFNPKMAEIIKDSENSKTILRCTN